MKKYFIYFMMYSVFGWVYEVFLETVIYGWGFSNRGVLWGPYCPIYGAGAMLLLLCFRRLVQRDEQKNHSKPFFIFIKPLIIFVGCIAVATFLELGASYILEAFTGSWPWQTYAEYAINFQGRIALSPSIRFGVGGCIFLYLFQTAFEKLVGKMSDKVRNACFLMLLTIFTLDWIVFFFKNIV